MKNLIAALDHHRASMRRLIEDAEDTLVPADVVMLRTNDAALAALLSILRGRPLDKSFGPPGEWGYSTPIGGALHEWYRQEPAASDALLRSPGEPWTRTAQDLPDDDTLVLAYDESDGLYALAQVESGLAEDGSITTTWIDMDTLQPLIGTPTHWRHLDTPAKA